MSIYDFMIKDKAKTEISMSDYKGKVLLIVNTATGCGFTPQYEAMEALYAKYKEQGFELLDFPCNQFLEQAPGTDEEINSFCKLNYGTNFKTFSKIEVNGENADPLYKFLKENAPEEIEDEGAEAFKKVLTGLSQTFTGTNIKWNFTKFLIAKDGTILARFAPTFKPEDIESYIEKALNS